MKMKTYFEKMIKHPLVAVYGTLLGIIAFSTAIQMCVSSLYDVAIVDVAMAIILITLMLKTAITKDAKESTNWEKIIAWIILIIADIIALLPTHNFAGSLCSAIAFVFIISALILYFNGSKMAIISILPTIWCCVVMPYHEELMLLLSYPLRLSATILSGGILNLLGISIIQSGTSLTLPNLNIAITDACSGINQMDAFILIAFIAVQMLHKNTGWKILHFAFIMPALIIGNSLRIVITVLLYKVLGETVLENSWHIGLGYSQIIFAFIIFLAIGFLFSSAQPKVVEDKL